MKRLLLLGLPGLLAASVWADAKPVKPAVVPTEYQWVRSIDTEGYAQEDDVKTGVQHFHFRLRYLDPDFNAFVGMQTDIDHFNRALNLGNPTDGNTGHALWDMGANIGIVHRKTTWELDLMGVTAASKLGPAVAIVYEHRFNAHWMYTNRLQGDIFVGDGILDLDQELCWTIGKSLGVTAGYRGFGSLHMSRRSGPLIGLRYSFDSPKIPFIFPSLD